MTQPKVYLVVGWSGQYSDFTQWPVTAYSNPTDAWAHVQRAQSAIEVWKQNNWESNEWEDDSEDKRQLTALFADIDPKQLCGYQSWTEERGYEMWEVPIGVVGGCRVYDMQDGMNQWERETL
jgi:hypothetical protein